MLGEAPMGTAGAAIGDPRPIITLPQQVLEIATERQRQETLKAEGRFTFTCADPCDNAERLAVLLEEVGEAAEAVQAEQIWDGASATLIAAAVNVGDAARVLLNMRRHDRGEIAAGTAPADDPNRPRERKTAMRKELVQVAAVALAFIEGLDAEGSGI